MEYGPEDMQDLRRGKMSVRHLRVHMLQPAVEHKVVALRVETGGDPATQKRVGEHGSILRRSMHRQRPVSNLPCPAPLSARPDAVASGEAARRLQPNREYVSPLAH